MVQAAISPSGEFLGLIIPKADLGATVSIFGTADDWEALVRGESIDPSKVGVVMTAGQPSQQQYPPECIEIDVMPGGEGQAS